MDFLDKIHKEVMESYAIQLEGFITNSIQPKPKYLPKFIWNRIVKRVVTINIYTPTVQLKDIVKVKH